MEKRMRDYAAFEKAMDEMKLYMIMDFDGICREIKADRDTLNETICRELGFDGQELVDYYKYHYL